MDISRHSLSLEEIKNTDLVDYLSSLGYEPKKIRNHDYWYLSPLREERTPSFKVNRKINRWYDHGTGKGGNVIDFIVLLDGSTIGECLAAFRKNGSFQSSPSFSVRQITKESSPLEIRKEKEIKSFVLIRYLHKRNIPFAVAGRYCREVSFEINRREYYAIGFKNDSGGFELRNEFLKISSRPKDLTTIINHSDRVAVFEGFIDFLSVVLLLENTCMPRMDYCILNSLAFFEKARPFLENHKRIHLFLDNDKAGINTTLQAIGLGEKYTNENYLYKNYKDLNDWIVNIGRGKRLPP